MEPFDPFASDREDDDDDEVEENNLFSQRARKGDYEEEFYHEVETTHLPPLGLGLNDDSEFDFDEDDDEASMSQHEDVFGMSLADVDLWNDDDGDDDGDQDNPFGSPTRKDAKSMEFPGFAPMEQTSEKKRDSLNKTSSKGRLSSSSKDGKRRSSASSSRNPSHRSKSLDDVEFLATEFSSSFAMNENPFTSENDQRERRSQTSSTKGSSRSRQPPTRSKSSNYSKDESGAQDRIGELMDIIKREKAQEGSGRKERGSSRGSSERSDRHKHHHSNGADDDAGSSLRQKLMTDKSASDKRRVSSSAASTSSAGKRVSSSGQQVRRKSHDESISSWTDMAGEKRHPPRRTNSRTTSKGSDGRVGLDSFMKNNRSSRRADAEHRSVVSAPATTSAETLSKKCQEMKLTF